MRSKLAFMIAAALIVCLVASIGRGSEKFYYGSFHVQALPEKLQEMKDSLRFNMVFGFNAHNYIDALANASLQIVAEQPDDDTSPSFWAERSHYTVWEAEGYPGSNYGFSYTGGRLTSDGSASGGKAWVFRRWVDQVGLIQTGPSYDQEYKDIEGSPIDYTAEFRIKSPDYNPREGDPPSSGTSDDTVCILRVVGNGQLLEESVVYTSAFKNFIGYKEFEVSYQATQNPIEFQIYWFGKRTLYIDYVKVYDEVGEFLMSGTRDSAIVAYVNQDWVKTTIPTTGDTVVYRWYMRDEPMSIDCYRPYAYINSLLQDDTIPGPHIPGAQWVGYFSDSLKNQEYLLRSDPVEYMIDLYPFLPGDTGSSFQPCVDTLALFLNGGKRDAEDHAKKLWVAIQAHAVGRRKTGAYCGSGEAEYEYPPGSGVYYCVWLRDPTPNEVRLQTFLAMSYGADAVMNYRVDYYLDSLEYDPPYLEAGLYDLILQVPTPKWNEIKNFTGPRVEKLGPIIAELTWQGACFHEDIGSFVLRNGNPSYIDSIVGTEPESTYVQVGFFEDEWENRYLMLVNRQCLENENQSMIAYLDSAVLDAGKIWYVIDQYSQDTTFTGAINGTIPLTTHLEPGEGKLFKLASFPDSAFHGTAHPFNWQGGEILHHSMQGVDEGAGFFCSMN